MSENETRPARLEPPVTEASAPFWDATRRRELMLPWCEECDAAFWFPREVCPRCLSPKVGWRPSPGRGAVYAVTVEHKPAALAAVFGGERYAVALVELDEGVRLMANVVGTDPDEVRIDDPVVVTWEALSDGRHLPLFEPASRPEPAR
jgi:uncharacterized OB-fold protein